MTRQTLRYFALIHRMVFIALSLLVLLACWTRAADSQESSGKRIRIGMPNRGVTTLGLAASQAYGFFAPKDFMPS